MTIATIIASYFTMFIMTYIGLYIYHRRQRRNVYDAASYMQIKRKDMINQSIFWPYTLVVSIFISGVKSAAYIGDNFFGMLDLISEKLFESLPTKKNEKY